MRRKSRQILGSQRQIKVLCSPFFEMRNENHQDQIKKVVMVKEILDSDLLILSTYIKREKIHNDYVAS